MRPSRPDWWLAGVVAGLAGLATSYATAVLVTDSESPVVSVADLVIRLTPGPAVDEAIGLLGRHDKTFLVGVVLLLTLVGFGYAGRLAATSRPAAVAVVGLLAVAGGVAVALQPDAGVLDVLTVVIGFLAWWACLSLLTKGLAAPPPDPAATTEAATAEAAASRRELLLRSLAVAVGAVLVAGAGRAIGGARRQVEATRKLLRLRDVSKPGVPAGARLGVPGVTPWITPADEFYRIDTAVVVPSVDPATWRLRIHGLVDREVELGYEQLAARELTESWVTINCVSNPVGGDLIGNAWWSGVPLADLLAEAGVQPGADAVLQTSYDGWTCGTPLSALTDDRGAMLALAMNGDPLPLEHGFPVRTIVPGLYGYVSACKWLVDIEVSRFDAIEAYWTSRGWSELGPVKMSSRIDVVRPGAGGSPGATTIAGVAWAQHTGIAAVEVSVDGGPWRATRIGAAPSADTWVQWASTVDLAPGEHLLRVRARDRDGLVQTGVQRDVVPDGATGWHSVTVTVEGA